MSHAEVRAVEVQADSLFEAVALAVAEFRADDLTATPGPMPNLLFPSNGHPLSTGFG